MTKPTRGSYDDYPDHPLHGAPEEFLVAAREALAVAAEAGDVDPELSDSIADSVVIQLKPWLTSCIPDLRVEHLVAGDMVILEIPPELNAPASVTREWAERAAAAVPAGVSIMVVAGKARVLRPEEAGAIVQLAHERLRTTASAVVDHFNQHGATEPLELGAAIVELAHALDSTELVEETIPRRQETYLVQKWFESERGWGQRSDGWSLHRNREELDAYVKAYWDSIPSAIPDEYSAPDGEPRVYPGSVFTDEQIAKLDDSTNGARFWGHPPEVG